MEIVRNKLIQHETGYLGPTWSAGLGDHHPRICMHVVTLTHSLPTQRVGLDRLACIVLECEKKCMKTYGKVSKLELPPVQF